MTTALIDGATRNARPSTLDELGSRIVGAARRIAAATCRWLLMVFEFDAREGLRPLRAGVHGAVVVARLRHHAARLRVQVQGHRGGGSPGRAGDPWDHAA